MDSLLGKIGMRDPSQGENSPPVIAVSFLGCMNILASLLRFSIIPRRESVATYAAAINDLFLSRGHKVLVLPGFQVIPIASVLCPHP